MAVAMETKKRLLVIIPAYNEERRIRGVVRGIRERLGGQGDILVINDGSADATAQRALEEGASVVTFPFNLGYGSALKAGYKYALRNEYDIVIQMDGDGQHDPSAIPDLVRPIVEGRAKVVLGSRFLGGSYEMPLTRRVGQSALKWIIRTLSGKQVTDPTTGYQAIHSDVLALFCSDDFPSDYPDADVLLLLHFRGYEFCEVPAVFHAGEKGKSMHAGWKPLYYAYKMLLSILLVALRHGMHRKMA
jgi:hypothetical protein